MARFTDRPEFSVPMSRRDHVQGTSDAVVTLVKYGDYECSRCAAAYMMVKDAQRLLGSQLRFVFRHFPLREVHPRAQYAAEAAEAASAQGRFWEMHEILFEHQHALRARHLRDYAAAVGLDALRFDYELAAHVYAKRVRHDALSGSRSGVDATPTFFINGVRHDRLWDVAGLMQVLRPLVAA